MIQHLSTGGFLGGLMVFLSPPGLWLKRLGGKSVARVMIDKYNFLYQFEVILGTGC
jgi:hypothetical protein